MLLKVLKEWVLKQFSSAWLKLCGYSHTQKITIPVCDIHKGYYLRSQKPIGYYALTLVVGKLGKPETFTTSLLPDCVLSSLFCCNLEFIENITGEHPIVSSPENLHLSRQRYSELKYF